MFIILHYSQSHLKKYKIKVIFSITKNLAIMKKNLSGCSECGDDTAILTQVSSGPEIILLCTDCYNLKHSNETQNHISYEEENN